MPDQLQLCHPKTVELRTSLYIFNVHNIFQLYLGLSPLPVRVTTRIVTFLVGTINLHFHYYWEGGQPKLYPFFMLPNRKTAVARWSRCCVAKVPSERHWMPRYARPWRWKRRKGWSRWRWNEHNGNNNR